jgi:SAM-dependent methyltransferase
MDHIDPKAGERAYYANLSPEGLAHARKKPFSDVRVGHYLADMGALLTMLEPAPRRILDLGCGTGWTSRMLARAGYDVTGVDIAADAIRIAQELAAEEKLPSATFLVGDYETPLPANTFDYVLFYDALHHAEDESAALRTACQALKPGGALFAFEPGKGHHRSKGSQHAIKAYGVHEKDMPPAHIWAVGRRVGFTRRLVLPTPHDINRRLYRRDYHAATAAGRGWLEKLWGYYRATQSLLFTSKGALTILWK